MIKIDLPVFNTLIDKIIMEFETSAQKACYEKIAPWMLEIFGDLTLCDENRPLFVTNFGSAIAATHIFPWSQEDDAIITTRSTVVTNVDLSLELMNYLLRENELIRFGRFAIDRDNDIMFAHSLLGSTCDRQELKVSVESVAQVADEFDDKIVAQWGGERALDRWAIADLWK